MRRQTILVELSHPHSLRLLQELEQVKAIKLITSEAQIEDMAIPEWHKDIVRNRVTTSKDTEFIPLDEAFKKLKLE